MVQMALNGEMAAKLAGEKALRAAQEQLAGVRDQQQAAKHDAERRQASPLVRGQRVGLRWENT